MFFSLNLTLVSLNGFRGNALLFNCDWLSKLTGIREDSSFFETRLCRAYTWAQEDEAHLIGFERSNNQFHAD